LVSDLYRAIFLISPTIFSHSSLVGAIIMACGYLCFGLIFKTSGKAKATVLPEPVLALAIISLPSYNN